MNLDFVRATYWLGAFASIGGAVQLLRPAGSSLLGFPGLRAPGAAGQSATIAAVLMLGWAAVLVWGHLRTRERRTLLVIQLAVLSGLATVNVTLGATGLVEWTQLAPALAVQIVLAVMFAQSFAIARKAALATQATAT